MSVVLNAILISGSSGCSDHEPTDFRDHSAGTYAYTMTRYIVDGTTLVPESGDPEDSGTFVLSKSDAGIDLNASGARIFRGENCTEGLNGYYFTILEQGMGYDNGLVIITGFEGNNFNGEKYEGVYDRSTGKITAYFSTRIRFTTSQRVFEFVGVKAK